MNNYMKKYQHKGCKALSMLFAVSLALAGTAALSACSSDDDPYFTASADDAPRILNTDLTDKTIDRTTPLQMEVKVTPMQYTTVTWLLDGQQIAEGFAIDQLIPVGDHSLQIVATTVRGKSTSRTIRVSVMPIKGDPDYVDPSTLALWEGDVTIDWDDKLCRITAQEMADVPVGATIKVYYELVTADYHAMRITSPWWGKTPEDDFVTQFDLTADTPSPFTFTFDDHCKALLDERGAMCVVGFGYKVTKITYENQ